MAGLALSVKVVVAGQRGWRSGWLDPVRLLITTDGQPSETLRPSQVEKICSWPRQRDEEDVALEPRATLPPPDPGDRGKMVWC